MILINTSDDNRKTISGKYKTKSIKNIIVNRFSTNKDMNYLLKSPKKFINALISQRIGSEVKPTISRPLIYNRL